MHLRRRLYLPAAALGWLFTAGSAQAEIVVLTSGQALSVKSYRVEGQRVVLQMRSGGEITCDKSLIQKVVPDELPDLDLEAPESETGPAVAAEALATGPYGEIIAAFAEAHGVSPTLVRALIKVESNYRPTARSHRGAMGLMQLMPSTARQYNLRNPYDPKANIAAGVKHLRALIDRWGVELALAAYNAGEGAVKKFNGIPPYRETRDYVSRVLSLAGIK